MRRHFKLQAVSSAFFLAFTAGCTSPGPRETATADAPEAGQAYFSEGERAPTAISSAHLRSAELIFNRLLKADAGSKDETLISPLSVQSVFLNNYLGLEAGSESQGKVAGFLALGGEKTSAAKYFAGFYPTYKSASFGGAVENVPELEGKQKVEIAVNNRVYVNLGARANAAIQSCGAGPQVMESAVKAEAESYLQPEYLGNLRDLGVDLGVFNSAKAGPSAKCINTWVEKSTADLIKNLVPDDMTAHSTYILVNTVYFHGVFGNQFKVAQDSAKRDLVKMKFEGEAVQGKASVFKDMEAVQMKALASYKVIEDASQNFTAIQVPYVDEFSLVLIKPNTRSTVGEFAQGLPAGWLAQTLSALETAKPKRVALTIPAFEARRKYEDFGGYFDGLNSMGPFSRMVAEGKPGYAPDTTITETVIITFDKGSIFAAATAQGTSRSAVGPAPADMNVDFNRSFLFVLKHNKTNTVLGIGTVKKPEPPKAWYEREKAKVHP